MIELRPLELSDEARVLSWRNTPEISRFMYSSHTISKSEHRAWIMAAVTEGPHRHWVIHYKGLPVGLVSVTKIDSKNSSAEWAFYLAEPSVRGKGVGSAVEFLILEFVFKKLGLNRLSCAVLAFNEAVISMHESFGFSREGILRSAIRRDEEWVDVVMLSQLRREWEPRRDEHRHRLFERGLIS